MNMTSRPTTANASALKQDYQDFLRKASTLFPKVDQKLLLNILQLQTTYSDWEGSVMLKVVYPAGTDMDKKKEWIFQKFQRMASIEEDKTLRFKAIHIHIEDLDRLLSEDPNIEFITGSATLAPTEAYSA
ncbi:hypothetical protein Ngar_c12120 [Candidatus Nitrososphaera gargensis Ga9.2]|uniref:Uncharacterized protein n=2 Tax=Candidatus Nitrososphaera gargensis TaxID=497727 RepID=K0IJ29_NITGG|nr:hypothetical protein Ngar_c12120 [Candidatus Nitrososphaera gargensis Ga9.2]